MKSRRPQCACGTASSERDVFAKLDDILERHGREPGSLIPVLQDAQILFGYLPENVLRRISLILDMSYSRVAGVVGFYSFFSTRPRGRYLIRVCLGTACYVRGGGEVLEEMKRLLAIDVGGTTNDGMFTLEAARCFGACGLAPVLTINEDIHQKVRPSSLPGILDKYRNKTDEKSEIDPDEDQPAAPEGIIRKRLPSLRAFRTMSRRIRRMRLDPEEKKTYITVHMGTCGIAAGARDIFSLLMGQIGSKKAEDVVLRRAGCAGMCSSEPMITVIDRAGYEYCYGPLDVERTELIFENHILRADPVKELLIRESAAGARREDHAE